MIVSFVPGKEIQFSLIWYSSWVSRVWFASNSVWLLLGRRKFCAISYKLSGDEFWINKFIEMVFIGWCGNLFIRFPKVFINFLKITQNLEIPAFPKPCSSIPVWCRSLWLLFKYIRFSVLIKLYHSLLTFINLHHWVTNFIHLF